MKRFVAILLSLTLLLFIAPVFASSNQYVQRQSDIIPEEEILQMAQLTEQAIAQKQAEELQSSQDQELALAAIEANQNVSPQLLNIFGWFSASDTSNTASQNAVIGTNETRMTLGTPGSGRALETIKVYTRSKDLNIKYMTRLNGQDWSEIATGTYDLSQSSGNTENVEAKINNVIMLLDGPASVNYNIYYRIYNKGDGWLPWVPAGTSAVADDYNKEVNIESLEVRILPTSSPAPPEAVSVSKIPVLTADAYVEGEGWQDPVYGKSITFGTEGQGLRLEAFQLKTNNDNLGITYQAFVEDAGWLAPVSNGAPMGTIGENKRIEAIKIALMGPDASNYDIYYRTYVEVFGWLDWANNDQIAGTTYQNLRVEAVQVKILPKGAIVPGEAEVPALIAVDATEGQILRNVNVLRKERNLSLLTSDPALHTAAAARSAEISLNYSHIRPNSETYETVLSDISYRSDGLLPPLGENIITTADPTSAYVSFSVKPGCLKLMLTDYYKYFAYASNVTNSETGAGNSVMLLTDSPSTY